MFGKQPLKWPELQRRVDRGELLAIELAYAALEIDDEYRAKEIVEKLARARAGYLVDLPKHNQIVETIIAETKRLIEPLSSIDVPLAKGLNADQRKAVETALNHPFSIIAGGPGTGKTFTAAIIVDALSQPTCIAAPTGKATSHLAAKLKGDSKAGTLHQLLGIRNPLDYLRPPHPIDAELILVDECSMIDPPLFARLLCAIPKGARLILMGDVNQLPPVEGGSVFADLMASHAIPTATLQTCMRSDQSEILDLASSVLSGRVQDIRTVDLAFASGEIETIYQKIWQFVRNRDFTNFRILSTLRKGPLGVDTLNRFLLEKFASDRYPILITRNDLKRGFSNGDTAMVENGVAIFPDGRSSSLNELPPHECAYCLSVHKAQGSEYDDVLFLVPEGSELFGREVIYTAITRARKSLAIDGSLEQIQKALSRSALKPSSICQRLSWTKNKVVL